MQSSQPDQRASQKKRAALERNNGWNTAFNDLSGLIKIKHYSPKTLKTYTNWLKKFQGFTFNKDVHFVAPLLVKPPNISETTPALTKSSLSNSRSPQ